jgi:hypothetical protein
MDDLRAHIPHYVLEGQAYDCTQNQLKHGSILSNKEKSWQQMKHKKAVNAKGMNRNLGHSSDIEI